MEDVIDDGGLACLGIKVETNGSYPCQRVATEFYVGKTFWVQEFVDGVTTPKGAGRTVILCSPEKEYQDIKMDCFKMITTTKQINQILQKLREIDKLPRRVTLERSGLSYTFS